MFQNALNKKKPVMAILLKDVIPENGLPVCAPWVVQMDPVILVKQTIPAPNIPAAVKLVPIIVVPPSMEQKTVPPHAVRQKEQPGAKTKLRWKSVPVPELGKRIKTATINAVVEFVFRHQ